MLLQQWACIVYRSQAAQCSPFLPPSTQPPTNAGGLTEPCPELAVNTSIKSPGSSDVNAGGELVQGQPQGSFMQMLVDGPTTVEIIL